MKRVGKAAVLLAILALCGYVGKMAYGRLNKPVTSQIPTAPVALGDVRIQVVAKGELFGGNAEVLTGPMVAGEGLHITYLRKPGEAVKAGDIVVAFDTSQQEANLKEAQADLAEAEQKLAQAQANKEAEEEEGRYALEKAENDLKLAQLETRKNPLLASITAKENDLAVEAAQDHLKQVRENLATRSVTGGAGVAMENAGHAKAQAAARIAQQNIESMTLKSHHDGYVAVRQYQPNGFYFGGETLPLFQVGDEASPGMAIAEIPDLRNWRVSATLGELDRGHVGVHNPVTIKVPAAPGHVFHGSVKELGGSMGEPWDRHFACWIGFDDPSAELRPGMSAEVTITTDTLQNVLSVPTEAVFNDGARDVVYTQNGAGFSAREVKLVRRSDTRAVIQGVKPGELVALSNPLNVTKENNTPGGTAMGAVGR